MRYQSCCRARVVSWTKKNRIQGKPYDWVKLVIPMHVENRRVGLFLFGQRDLDADYEPGEIQYLQALSNQTTLALLNIGQSERLHALYQADIEREEAERTRLALELHDDVLGQMAMLAITAGDLGVSPTFDNAFQLTTGHIREIINGLRPAMLNYGLGPAILQLADDAPELYNPHSEIKIDLSGSEIRYPPDVELHLYRIVQQACYNALDHAKAATIEITAQLQAESAVLVIKDDGQGFPTGENLDLAWLLSHRHFGLAGMCERSGLIGADLQIQSALQSGTTIRVTWRARLP